MGGRGQYVFVSFVSRAKWREHESWHLANGYVVSTRAVQRGFGQTRQRLSRSRGGLTRVSIWR
eukprot:589939-Lingulodinium_polyedra.AAC.1